MATYSDIAQCVVDGDKNFIVGYIQEMLDNQADPVSIIQEGLIGGMNIVAPLFKNGEMFVPEVMLSAATMAKGVDFLKPYITDKDIPSKGTVVIGTVEGDLHDIGKNLVKMMMESRGYKVIDLGTDVNAEKYSAAIKEHNPNIMGMSSLLTTTMPKMKVIIDELVSRGQRSQVKIFIGGAPLTQEYSDEIGADGYAPDASSAVDLCDGVSA